MKDENILQLILEQSQIGFWDWNYKSNKIKLSSSSKVILGYSTLLPDDEMDIHTLTDHVFPEDLAKGLGIIQNHIKKGDATSYETIFRYQLRNGAIQYILTRGTVVERDEQGHPLRLIGSHVDITKHVKLEDEVNVKTELLKNIINNIPYCIFWKDKKSVFQGSNKSFANFYGYKSEDEIKNLPTHQLINHPKELLDKYVEADQEVMLNDKVMLGIITESINKEGEIIIVETAKVPLKDKEGNSVGLLGIFNDITENENLKKELLHSSKLYHIISQINKLLVQIDSKDQFFRDVCNIITGIGGFKLAWIGMVVGDEKNVVAYSGISADYLKDLKISIDDTPDGSGPFGICIRTNEKYICNDFQNDSTTLPWREKAIKSGIFSGIAFPINLKGKVTGALLVYEGVKDYFKTKEVALLEEIVVAIELGMEIIEQQLTNKIANNKISQLASMVQQSESFAGIINAKDQSFVYLNDALRKAYEITPDEDITKYKLTDFRNIDDIDLIKKVIFPSVQSKGVWSGEGNFISKSGKVIPVLQNVIPLRNEQGEIEFFCTTALDITQIKNKEKELEKLSQELSSLSHHLVSVKEKERKLIAKDIHDELGQDLTALKIGVSWLIKHIDDDKEKIINKLNEVSDIAVSTVQTSRRLYNSIYPQMLEEVGLIDTIRWHYKSYLQGENIKMKIVSNVKEDFLFTDKHDLCLTLFRVYQEAFANILRYAKATGVNIDINIENDFVTMDIEDNGVGFYPENIDKRIHHGLLDMRERVTALDGKLYLNSQIGIGTTVSVVLKISEDIITPANV